MTARGVLGLAAILALLGIMRVLPDCVSFFVGSIAIIFFPGIILANLVAPSGAGRNSLPERLVIWFVLGVGVLAVLGFAGLLVHARLNDLILVISAVYAVVTVLVLAKKIPVLVAVDSRSSPGQGPGWAVTVTLSGIALGAALLTLLSQRDSDDWFYLAYIRDFVANHPLGSEDAIFGGGAVASPRVWLGGAWWVVEALLSKTTGVDPVACHQVYLPLLVLPFAVFAVFALARRIFRCDKTAILACFLQMLFYVSSAYPYKGGGWMLFVRAAQDKTLVSFVIVPVVAALAIRFMNRANQQGIGKARELYVLYWSAFLISVLIHPLGIVWGSLFVIPFAGVELLRERSRRSVHILVMIVLPVLVCAPFLASGRGMVAESLTAEQSTPEPVAGILSSIYFPGKEAAIPTWLNAPPETAHPTSWIRRETFKICNPIFVTRYPLAISGLVLSFLLIPYFRSHASARFLLSVTFSILLLAFTPIGAAATAALITWKMLYRLTWILPWGLIIAFCLSRIRLRPLWAWLIVLMVGLVLARGNPMNYVTALSSRRELNRPTPEAVDAFRFLGSEPAPQGTILGSESTHKMIAAFLPDAYPTNYRDAGPIDNQRHRWLLGQPELDESAILAIKLKRIKYILLEKSLPLAQALSKKVNVFPLLYENDGYRLWKVALGMLPAQALLPELNLVLVTIGSLRPDHLGCYGYHKQTSPGIDNFANKSVIFERVACQSSQTLPSQVSILTGTTPRKHKAIGNGSLADENLNTLAEVLSGHGYVTAAFVGDRALNSRYGLDQGFDIYWEMHKKRFLRLRESFYEHGLDPTTEAALAWLREYSDFGFFLWIHWNHPDLPYNPPSSYIEAFAGGYRGTVGYNGPSLKEIWKEEHDLPEEDLSHLIGRYDGEIAFADAQVGKVLAELDSLELYKNTVVVITADHGDMLYEHEGYFGSDIGLYDECIMVPLVLYTPTIERGQPRVNELIRSIDIMPTLLDLLEVRCPDAVEGKSLIQLVAGSSTSSTEYAFSETFPSPSLSPPRHAVRTSDSKLIWKETRSGPIAKEFYDLETDPDERHNLYSLDHRLAAHLDSVLTAWIEHGGLHPAEIPQPTGTRGWSGSQDSEPR